MIEIRQVSKSYGRSVVVDDVTITLPPGGITSIVGANGAGKSTLLSMVARLLPSDSGTITVGGHNVATTPTADLATVLGILKQDNGLEIRLTVDDLVGFGRYPHSKGRRTASDQVAIDAAIEHMDLVALRDRFLDEMSGGQRQRAFVAMLLAQDTTYLLLDEPLNNLDLAHSLSMLRRLRSAADDLGKTIVMVIHDINFASAWSDQIVAMKDGRIVLHGPPLEVVNAQMLADVFGVACPVDTSSGRPIAQYHLPDTDEQAARMTA